MSNSSALSSEIVKAIVQQYFAASRATDKVKNMVACFAEDCVNYDPVEGPTLTGKTELSQFLQTVVNLFSRVELTEEFISVNGNEAAVKWTGRGMGNNGREVVFEGIDLFEVNAEGKIQSLRGYWNPMAVLMQLQGDS